jgi:hypothetical protein
VAAADVYIEGLQQQQDANSSNYWLAQKHWMYSMCLLWLRPMPT